MLYVVEGAGRKDVRGGGHGEEYAKDVLKKIMRPDNASHSGKHPNKI
jgi:hypothetical protein